MKAMGNKNAINSKISAISLGVLFIALFHAYPMHAKNVSTNSEMKNNSGKPSACSILNGPYAKVLSSGAEVALNHLCGVTGKRDYHKRNPVRIALNGITDIRVNDPEEDTISDQTTQVETSIASDTVHGTIVEAYVDSGQFAWAAGGDSLVGWSISTDNGLSWIDKGKFPTLSGNWLLGSPSLAFEPSSGNLYFAGLMCSPATCDFEKIEVARSTDGGQTWNQIVNAVSNVIPSVQWDKPFIAIDNSGVCSGYIYLVATDVYTGDIKFTLSYDHGVHWLVPFTIDAHQNCDTGAMIKIAPDGTIYVVWEDYNKCMQNDTYSGIELVKSSDCGATWSSATSTVDVFTRAGDPGATADCGTNALKGDIRIRDYPSIGVDPANSANLYVTYNMVDPDPTPDRIGDASDIFFVQSDNGGTGWSMRQRLNDDADADNPSPNKKNDNFMPVMQVSGNGKILVSWYDRREDPDNLLMRVWGTIGTISTGGDINWSPNFPISSTLFPPEVNFDPMYPSQCYMGDYNNAASDSTNWHLAFTDTRRIENNPPHTGPRNDPDVYYVKFPIDGPGGLLYFISTTTDGDNDPDPGEVLALHVMLKNVGTATVSGIMGTLSSSTSGVTIYKPDSTYPNLVSGQSGNNDTPFIFGIAPTVSCGTKLSFTLDVNNSSAGTFSFPFTIQTGAMSSPATVFSDNFTGGITNWTVSNTCGGDVAWHFSQLCKSLQTTNHTSPYDIYFGVDTACNYETGKRECGTITSNAIPLSSYNASATLDFNYFLKTEQNAPFSDLARVEISSDNGATWSTIADNTAKLTEIGNAWKAIIPTIDISQVAGSSNAKVRFSFDTIDAFSNDYDGFYIDDVMVKGQSWQCNPGVINLQPYNNKKPEIDDSDSTYPNGIIEPDEDVILKGHLQNAGLATAFHTTGLLSTADPISIWDSDATYGDIPANGDAICSDCYGVMAPLVNRPGTHWDFAVHEAASAYGYGPVTFNYIYHVGASFSDVPPDYLFYSYIEKLLHSTVTGGCTASTYCPDNNVDRQQMAKFICASINVSNSGACNISDNCQNIFTDVPASNIFCSYIEKLYEIGVVAGCQASPLKYCPLALTQRDAMAKFVCLGMQKVDPGNCVPVACAEIFADVPATNAFCPYIEALYNANVVSGCLMSPLKYCPHDNVSRAEMSKFLVNAFGFEL